MSETSLDAYIKEIQACSEYLELRDRFGIYDNWPILVHIPELSPLLDLLNQKPNYSFEGEVDLGGLSMGSKKYDYNHINGIANFRVTGGTFDMSAYIGPKEERALQQIYYPRGIRLHPYQNEEQQRDAPEWSWIGSVREVVCELSQDLREAGIPFCLTHSKLNGERSIIYSPSKPQLQDLNETERREYDELLPRTRNLLI